jgi:hypothetical protein
LANKPEEGSRWQIIGIPTTQWQTTTPKKEYQRIPKSIFRIPQPARRKALSEFTTNHGKNEKNNS